MRIKRLSTLVSACFFAFASAGCFDPSIPDNTFRCDENAGKGCPEGFTCIEGRCRKGEVHTDMTIADQEPAKDGLATDISVDGAIVDTSSDALAIDTTADGSTSDTTADGSTSDTTADGSTADTTADGSTADTTADTTALIPACPAKPVLLGSEVTDGPSRFDITVNSSGVPHIVVAETSTSLVLVTVDGVVSSQTLTPTAHHAGVTFDGSGQLHLVYSSAAHGDLMYYQRQSATGNWNTARELKIGYGVIVKSLDIDARGANVVVIGEGDRPDDWSQKLVVNVAPATPLVCSGTLGSGPNRFGHVRVSVGPTWTVESRYQQTGTTSGSLYLVNWPNGFTNCTTSAYSQVASGARRLLAAAADGAGVAHAVHVDPSANPSQLHYVQWSGGTDVPVDQMPVQGAIPESVDIAASPSGTAFIAYQNVDNGGNRRLHVLEHSGSGTRNPTLASAIGRRTRMHYDGTNVHLVSSDISGKLYYLCYEPQL